MRIFGKQLNGKKIIGDPKYFSLEERIFNTFCIIAFTTMCFEVPFNLFIGLMVPAALCVFGVFISFFLYYLSRFKRKSSLGIKLFCITCNITFAINYFYNSGIFGPNLLLFSLAFLLIIAIIPKQQFKFWIPINISLVLIILTTEYLNPHLAPYSYNSELVKALDFAITYFVVVVITYFAISYTRKNYDYERISAHQKNIAIEEQSERILAQKIELEHLNSEKDKLFSIVSHDIKLPLNSIQSYLEILTEVDLGEEEKQEVERQLLQITRDTSDMLMNILSWSKSQMKGANIQLMSLNVNEALAKGLSIEKNISARKGIAFTIEAKDELHIIADPNMFQLVIRNLVNNAIKFTRKGGLIGVVVYKENSQCIIMVKDNGLGIKAEQQEKLFKLKASSTYGTNNEKGIGLGLLLCKEFTELQNGKIWFESNAGEGSTFYLSFKLNLDLIIAE
ncbi:MAG: HAMP domain-containing sensor histidine kinase [Bacteroidota bacterium]